MRRLAPLTATLLPPLFALAAAVVLLLSILPLDLIHGALQRHAGVNLRRHVSPLQAQQIAGRARALAALLMILAGALWRWRVPLRGVLMGCGAELRALGVQALRYARGQLREPGPYPLALLLCTLSGAGFRLWHLAHPLSSDEGRIFYELVHRPAYVILCFYENVGNHVLHTLLTRASWLLLGDGALGLRAPVLVAGVLVPPLWYLVARLWVRREAALLAAALCAHSSALLEYSVHARGYMLQTLFMGLHLAACAYLQRPGRHRDRGAWLVYAGTAALSYLTLPTTLLLHGGLGLWLLCEFARGEPAQRRAALGALLTTNALLGLLVLLLYAPLWVVAGRGHLGFMAQRPPSLRGVGDAVQQAVLLWRLWHRNLPGALQAALAAALPLALWRWPGGGPRSPWPCLLAFGLCVGSLVFVGYARLWLAHAPLLYLAEAAGLSALLARLAPRRLVSPALLGLALVTSVTAMALELRAGHVRDREPGCFPEAPQVAQALQGALAAGPGGWAVLAPGPLFYPLLHELRARGLPAAPALLRNPAGVEVMIMAPGVLGRSSGLHQPRRLYVVSREGGPDPLRTLRRYGLGSLVEGLQPRGVYRKAALHQVDPR